MVKRGKKSQSEVITTVLIILLVLAAVAIVWGVVNNIVSRGAGSAGKGAICMEITIDIPSINTASSIVKVHRTAGGEDNAVANIKFLVNGKSATHNNTDLALGPLETKDYTINSTGLQANDKIEAAVILSDGTICDKVVSATAE